MCKHQLAGEINMMALVLVVVLLMINMALVTLVMVMINMMALATFYAKGISAGALELYYYKKLLLWGAAYKRLGGSSALN